MCTQKRLIRLQNQRDHCTLPETYTKLLHAFHKIFTIFPTSVVEMVTVYQEITAGQLMKYLF